MSWRFAPPWWAVLLTGFGMAATAALSTWQLGRGAEKQALVDRLEQVRNGPAGVLNPLTPAPPPEQMQRVAVEGGFLSEPQLLQRAPRRDQRAGYQLWSLFRLKQGPTVIVDRGWIDSTAEVPPPPAGNQRFSGLWRSLPRAGLALRAELCDENRALISVVYPVLDDLRCLVDQPLLDGLLLLQAPDTDTLIRDWQYAGMPPERHLGYAVQWGALCATIFLIFLLLNLKRRHD